MKYIGNKVDNRTIDLSITEEVIENLTTDLKAPSQQLKFTNTNLNEKLQFEIA